jgi:osmoprotectant transport system ATP-binding protein
MIRFEGVAKSYAGSSPALHGLTLEVQPAEFLVLLGPSGCGKTTTLKLINRLLEPSAGRILIQGQEVAGQDPIRLRRSIGYVFQRFGLFPHMTLAENVGIVPTLLGWPPPEIQTRTDELLDLLGLPAREYRGRFPRELSGGQQQRVGVARALASRPQIMLLDEPFGALDPLTRDRLQQEYARIHADLGLTTVMVTHDVTEALLLADRIALLEAGRLVQVAPPAELFAAPASPLVTELLATPRRQIERLDALAHGPGR